MLNLNLIFEEKTTQNQSGRFRKKKNRKKKKLIKKLITPLILIPILLKCRKKNFIKVCSKKNKSLDKNYKRYNSQINRYQEHAS